MGKRIQRTGLEALMECQRVCSRELMKLPKEDRGEAVEWLRRAVVPRDASSPKDEGPPVPDPRQIEIPIPGYASNGSGLPTATTADDIPFGVGK